MKDDRGESKDEGRRRRMTLRRLISMTIFALGVAAVVKELRTPRNQRTWHGLVAGFVPYDFRPPTLERIREKMWNEAGPLVNGPVFGVGWTVNLGAAKRLLAR